MTLLALALLLPLQIQEPSLAIAESLLKQAKDVPADPAGRAMLCQLIERDLLKGAADFEKAAEIWPTGRGRLEDYRVKYELAITAACLGSEKAKKSLAGVWDGLMVAVDRGQRFGSVKWTDKSFPAPAKLSENLTAKCIRDVWLGTLAKNVKTDNVEVKQLFDADQKVRENFKPNMTMKEMHDMVMGDHERMKRIREIVKKGALHTAKDFENAAFLFQHGERFMDYATAHELSVCSVLLGNKPATWIAGASYDRMMLAASYPQRFGTQYFGMSAKWEFDTIDTSLMNDTMRMAVIRKTLEQARNPKF